MLHCLARTAFETQLAYQDRSRDFHARLRRFCHPCNFNDVHFREAGFAKPLRSIAGGPTPPCGADAEDQLLAASVGLRSRKLVL